MQEWAASCNIELLGLVLGDLTNGAHHSVLEGAIAISWAAHEAEASEEGGSWPITQIRSPKHTPKVATKGGFIESFF